MRRPARVGVVQASREETAAIATLGGPTRYGDWTQGNDADGVGCLTPRVRDGRSTVRCWASSKEKTARLREPNRRLRCVAQPRPAGPCELVARMLKLV